MLKGAPENVVGISENPSLEPISKKRSEDELKLQFELLAQIQQEIHEIRCLQKQNLASLRQLKEILDLKQAQIAPQNNPPVNDFFPSSKASTLNPKRMREIKLNRHHRIKRVNRDKQLSPAFSLHSQKSSSVDNMDMKLVETKSKCPQARRKNIA